MTQTTVCRFLTKTRLFYNTCHIQHRITLCHKPKRTISSSIYRTSEVACRSSVTGNVLKRQWKLLHTNKIVVPALCSNSCQKRWFHISPRRQLFFQPLIWAFVKFGAKLGAVITGRFGPIYFILAASQEKR